MIYSITSFLFSLLVFIQLAFDLNLSTALQKRMHKEISKVFSCEDYELLEKTGKVGFELENSTYLTQHQIFEINRGGAILGYAFLGTAPSKTDAFDYLILFDPHFIQKKAKILIYREDYGGEISSKRWLAQFENSSLADRFFYGDNISAISGATISVKSMTHSINYVYAKLESQLVLAGDR
jgi:hypothetical protein